MVGRLCGDDILFLSVRLCQQNSAICTKRMEPINSFRFYTVELSQNGSDVGLWIGDRPCSNVQPGLCCCSTFSPDAVLRRVTTRTHQCDPHDLPVAILLKGRIQVPKALIIELQTSHPQAFAMFIQRLVLAFLSAAVLVSALVKVSNSVPRRCPVVLLTTFRMQSVDSIKAAGTSLQAGTQFKAPAAPVVRRPVVFLSLY